MARALALVPALAAVALSAGCSGGGGGGGPPPAVVLTSCDPVAQTGCDAGKKCTWLRTSSTSGSETGAMACTPAGSVDLGGTCQYGADGSTTGYDDCKAGLVCKASTTSSAATGTCAEVCSTETGAGCGAAGTWTCDAYSDFFASGGASATAGLCDSQCNPLTQQIIDGGVAACGSPDPAHPTKGCYGSPSQSTLPTAFTCSPVINAAATADASVTPPVYVNSCAPGFLPLLAAATGSTTAICVATCQPADTTSTAHANAGGVAPYDCQTKGGSSTEECRYDWWFEGPSTPAGTWSNGLGYCFDPARYTYDATAYGGPPNAPVPSCKTLSATGHTFDATVSDAAFWGCVAR